MELAKVSIAWTVPLLLIIAYLFIRDKRKKKKDDTNNSIASYQHETEESFNTRCRNHIVAYLISNQYKFHTIDDSATQFMVPFDADDGPLRILIAVENVKAVSFTSRITSDAVPDNMLSAIAELTNRMNAHFVNTQLYLDYETRHVQICKSLPISHYEVDYGMFDWYFRCVQSAGKSRAYLNRVLLNNESPALVALDYAHA